MTKRIQLLFLLTFLGFSSARAQRVGDVCTNPAIANLCGGNTFTANTANFKNDVSTWTFNGQTIYAYGSDIYYQINLPTSSYQPVNLYASLGGYFSGCSSCDETINFLWFENSPCSSNPVAVNSFNINGQSNLHDSLLVTYPVSNIQSQYYLVIDFSDNNYYDYNLQLGFSNNQPPPALNCSTMPAPYKGTIALDQSACYTSSNPYHLPLSALEDNLADSNTLFPLSLNQDLKYLPINDNSKNGFILTIKTTTGANSPYNSGYTYYDELYKSFDQFPYTYSSGGYGGGASYTYDVGLTVFFKNNGGASGIKGFRIQVPNSQTYYFQGAVPNANRGWYDTTGTWLVSFDEPTNTYTWLFSGKNGRGDNTDNNGYNCKVYTFDGLFANLGNIINAWYLADDYGNDTTECVYGPSNPPRTDCGIGAGGGYNNIGWIPLTGSLGGAGISGQQCGTDSSVDDGPVLSTCNQYGYYDYSDVSYDTSGCVIETDYFNDYETPDFVDDTLANSWYGNVYVGICNGQPYKMVLDGNGDYYSYNGATPTTVVYIDPITNVYHPVDSLGNILYSEDYYSLTIPDDLPPYPSNFNTYSFTIPLSVPGTYTLIYTEYYYDYYYGEEYYPSYDCTPANLILVNDTNPVISLSTADTTICKGQSVDIAINGVTNFSWMPDSTVAGTFSSYNQSGAELHPLSNTTYTVIGTDNYGCSSSPANVVVNVKYCPPTASFYYYYYCSSSCNYFVNESSYYFPTQGLWSFPGGTPSSIPYDRNAQGVSVCYNTPGVYQATLYVSNPAGQDSLTEYVQVGTCNVLAFATASDTAICSGNCVSFHNYTPLVPDVQSFIWQFPGSTSASSSGNNTQEQVCYANAGTYIASLIAIPHSGPTDTFNITIHVSNCGPIKPVAAFTAPDTVCNANCITISNTSTGNPTGYVWSFNGGTPSSYNGQTPPNICYAKPGNYSIQLIVTNSNGADTTSKTILVKNCIPTASFIAPDSVCNANCITVSNLSSANATSWQWSFAGGIPSSYSGQTPPSVCYANAGSYKIQLIAGNGSGNDTLAKTLLVKNCKPSASFTAPDSVCNANCITISNSTSANATSWQWSFAGGTPSTYSGQTPPSVCYADAGSYTIRLIVGNSSGSDTMTKAFLVNNCIPQAAFVIPDSVCNANCISIVNSSYGNITSWQWSFAGGTPSVYSGQTPPSICYANTGSYAIRLIVGNSSGNDTMIKTIKVADCIPVASFSAPDSTCMTNCITVTNSSSANTFLWQWFFAGGTPSYYYGQTPPTICYSTAGNYQIKLVVNNTSGADTAVKTITVNNCQPVASFTTKDTICKTDCVAITNTSPANITSWKWLFPGGTPSSFNSKAPPSICYNSTGVYTAELIASNTYGSDTGYHTIDVNDCSPFGGIIGADSICAGDCTTFQNTSSANSSNWSWLFDGGVPSSYVGQNPPAVCYQSGGNYVARLIVSNNYGVDTVFKNIKVNKFSAGDITANYNPACEGAPVIFTLSGNSGTIQWQSSDTTFNFNNIQNANSATYKIPSAAGNLYVRVVSVNGSCTDTSDIYKLIVYPPITVNYTWKDSAADVVFHSQVSPPNNLVYAWNFGDDSTSNLINPVHLFKDYSSYYACLTVYTTANCSFTFCDHVSRDIGTAINPSPQSEINVYPDPFSDYLLIKAQGKRVRSIELYDVLGRQVINETIGENYPIDNVLRLDATGLIDGMYFIRIKTDGDDYIQSVVRIHP